MKMNMKFPLWGTLAMVAVFTYLPAATKANAIRGENIRKREEEELKNPKKTNQKAIGSATETRRIVAKTNQGEQIEVTAPAPVAKEYIPEKKQVVINTPPPPPPPPPPPVRKQVIPAKIEKPEKKSQSDDQMQEQTITPPPPPAPVIRRVPRTGQKTRGGSHKA